jgi:hypothetical protein
MGNITKQLCFAVRFATSYDEEVMKIVLVEVVL